MRRNFSLMLTIFLSAIVFSTTASAQQRFFASVNGNQEVPVRAIGGTGRFAVTLNAAETEITVSGTYTGTTSNVVAGHIHDNGPVGVNGPVRFNFAFTGGTSGTVGPLTFAVTPAQVADLRANRWYVNIHTANFTGGEIRGQIKRATSVFDFDGDGRTDIKAFRPSTGNLFVLNSLDNSFGSFAVSGTATINTASDDYDGDGRGDFVGFAADGTTRIWLITQSGTNTLRVVRWGTTAADDQLVPADYDGDGRTDIAVYRRSTRIWYIVRSSDNQTQAEVFGSAPNDIAMVGDFDKDGRNDLTTVRGTIDGVAWYSRLSSTGNLQTILWGGVAAPATDFVFPSAQIDIDGDGRQDHLVQRDPSGVTVTGAQVTYFVRRSSDGQMFVLQWGLDSDARLFGDYDGDGKTDFVARRTDAGQFVWYIYQSSNGQLRVVNFGTTGDQRATESDDSDGDRVEVPMF